MLVNPAFQKQPSVPAAEQAFYFFKKDGYWWLQLPHTNGHPYTEVALTSGIDELLQLLAGRRTQLWLQLATTAFLGASVLVLDAFCPAPDGGAFYRIYPHRGRPMQQRLWVCEVSLLIFGDFPERIYYKLLKRGNG